MLVLGTLFGLAEPTLTVAAALSVQSPFLRPAHPNPDCATARRPLESPHGDPLTLLNVFNEWVQVGFLPRERGMRRVWGWGRLCFGVGWCLNPCGRCGGGLILGCRERWEGRPVPAGGGRGALSRCRSGAGEIGAERRLAEVVPAARLGGASPLRGRQPATTVSGEGGRTGSGLGVGLAFGPGRASLVRRRGEFACVPPNRPNPGCGGLVTPSLPPQELLRDHQLLEEASNQPSDSYSRQSRHRERRELHRLWRSHAETEGRKRKVLRLQDGADGSSGEEDDGGGTRGKGERGIDIQVTFASVFSPGKRDPAGRAPNALSISAGRQV